MTSSDFLPYAKQHVSQEDIDAVVGVLKSDWWTQGPTIEAFEKALAKHINANHAISCSNGTAALHLTMLALGLGKGDAIVTSPITFLASANCARFVGADVKFSDIDPRTGNLCPKKLEEVLSNDKERKIRAVIAVHLTGNPADLEGIAKVAAKYDVSVIEDAAHAVGASFRDSSNKKYFVGANPYSSMTTFSFHPVKHIAMGEGGAVSTQNDSLAESLKKLRSHGMQKKDFKRRDLAFDKSGNANPWYYEMQEIGYNYRITDIQCALGLVQLGRLSWSMERRRAIAAKYNALIAEKFTPDEVRPLTKHDPEGGHAYHLFVTQIDFDKFGLSRAEVMNALRADGVGTQVHYIPVHWQPYYKALVQKDDQPLPNAEAYYERALSLPMYPNLTDENCERVINSLNKILKK